jgi:hypothetical protein
MKITRFRDIPKFISSNYTITLEWDMIERWLSESMPESELNPDFQRGHVWTRDKQIKYVEYILRGGKSSKDIYFNHPGWNNNYEGKCVLIDGKQRLEAARAFLRDEFPVFGSLYSEYTDKLRISEAWFNVHINCLPTRAEELQWYLDLNSGGVVHTDDELSRVRELLEKEKTP